MRITQSTVEKLNDEIERLTGTAPVESISRPGDGRTHYVMTESFTSTYYGARTATAYLLGILDGLDPEGSVHHVDARPQWIADIDNAYRFDGVPGRQRAARTAGVRRGTMLRAKLDRAARSQEGPDPAEYKFDQLAVLTYTVTTAAGLEAARDAAGALDTLCDGGADGWETTRDVAPDVTWELRCIATRGDAYLVETSPDLGLFEDLPQPPAGDWRDLLRAALEEADEALGGDSNDAEHDALHSLRETLAGLLGVTTDAPSPDYGNPADTPWGI
jgi:hypothetical protein